MCTLKAEWRLQDGDHMHQNGSHISLYVFRPRRIYIFWYNIGSWMAVRPPHQKNNKESSIILSSGPDWSFNNCPTLRGFGTPWAHFRGTLGSLFDHFGITWGSLWLHLGGTLGHFGITFGCMKVTSVPLSLIFRKYSFSQWIWIISYNYLLNLVLLGGYFGMTYHKNHIKFDVNSLNSGNIHVKFDCNSLTSDKIRIKFEHNSL